MNPTISEVRRTPIIALDADGVLLDYHHSYRNAWERAFGERPALRDANAYWPIDRWQVRKLEGVDLDKFRACFDQDFWSTIPAVDGAIEACHLLASAGYSLVCVSAIPEIYKEARLRNLRDAGFPIESVVATDNVVTTESPKAAAIRTLDPAVFVDDYLPYLFGIPATVHTALILREANGSPNQGADLRHAKSTHANLLDFARWWTSSAQLGNSSAGS